MKKFQVISAFPKALFFTDNEFYQMSDEEMKSLHALSYSKGNLGNKTTDNLRVLELPEFEKLKDHVTQCIDHYARDFLKFSDNVNFQVSTSWFNKQRRGDYVYPHTHPNSLVSGVLAITNLNQIRFDSPLFPGWDFDYSEQSPHNASSIDLLMRSGAMVLFPSHLHHSVLPYDGEDERISLAFNVMPYGHIAPGSSQEILINN